MTTAYTTEQLAHFTRVKEEAAPPPPTGDDLKVAIHVAAISAASAPEGMLITLKAEQAAFKLFLNPVLAKQLLEQLVYCGRVGTWWDENLDLLPMVTP